MQHLWCGNVGTLECVTCANEFKPRHPAASPRHRTKPNFVEVVPRSANGDYEVDLKLTPNSPINDFANGQSDAEIRTIFTRPSEFQLKEQLGQGGFGVVYRAKTGGEEVAIKMLRMDQPEFVLSDLKINNEMLRVFGDTPYEQLFSLPRGVLKLKRPGRDDQLALVMDKMEYVACARKW